MPMIQPAPYSPMLTPKIERHRPSSNSLYQHIFSGEPKRKTYSFLKKCPFSQRYSIPFRPASLAVEGTRPGMPKRAASRATRDSIIAVRGNVRPRNGRNRGNKKAGSRSEGDRQERGENSRRVAVPLGSGGGVPPETRRPEQATPPHPGTHGVASEVDRIPALSPRCSPLARGCSGPSSSRRRAVHSSLLPRPRPLRSR